MHKIRLIRSRWTTRHQAVAVLVVAVLLAGFHPDGPRPGFHASLGGVRAGICRNRTLGRTLGDGGRPRAWAIEAGAWGGDGPRDTLILGLRWWDGTLRLARFGRWTVLW